MLLSLAFFSEIKIRWAKKSTNHEGAFTAVRLGAAEARRACR